LLTRKVSLTRLAFLLVHLCLNICLIPEGVFD
jgi:hypothetical protein